MRVSWVTLLLLCTSLFLASGSGDDGGWGPVVGNPVKATASFMHGLVHREHVFEANLMRLSYPSVPEHKRVSRYAESGCESV